MRYNVLIVEDDKQMAASLAAQLSVLGHVIGITYGPRQAIRQLNEVIPDIIFVDINMPGVDGLELIRFLRRDPATASVPIVVVSAEEQEKTKATALEAGANHYLTKPPMLEDLEDAIATVITEEPPHQDDDATANPAATPASPSSGSAS